MTARRPRRGDAGFTIIEVLVALTVMAIGLVGVLALEKGAVQASGYSRRATEASVLGEDKLEELRTVAIRSVVGGSDRVDAAGTATTDGPFTRTWTIDWISDTADLGVAVSWEEPDGSHQISFRTKRSQ
ncbi:MAG: prepilin-type N-terminal cleavage/methylation domain-containing protein [Kofleriaceae bacterium]|nr:prepilin-type N-terminal cleavage/methylation domain-containing protein [Myxococcales bacterium]MCB9562610.1 prepilin-type N-terminal cleavage/methylation domain-containing protein [Kofleriaceae bacterium]MCB9574543.1 prepilin-type N-terminal cleavage/methylation domain-containing protein [Kofleriaceae bacterium]